jgi:hypothetical protein
VRRGAPQQQARNREDSNYDQNGRHCLPGPDGSPLTEHPGIPQDNTGLPRRFPVAGAISDHLPAAAAALLIDMSFSQCLSAADKEHGDSSAVTA